MVDTWISTEETHKIEGLAAGKTYILREEAAPMGYEIAEDIEFTVKNKNDYEVGRKNKINVQANIIK